MDISLGHGHRLTDNVAKHAMIGIGMWMGLLWRSTSGLLSANSEGHRALEASRGKPVGTGCSSGI